MGLIPRETIEEVLANTDIVELIGNYIPLKRAGNGYKANCPFHHEKTPSFNVSATRQFYHCFGCQKSGNAISFVMEHEGLVFMDALKKLASKAGVTLEEAPDDPKARAARKLRGRLLDLHRESAEFFNALILKSENCQHARDYLKSRNFGREMAMKWQIGWMPSEPKEFLNWARERGYKGRELVAAGLAGLKNEDRPSDGIYVRFRDRLMFPIHNEIGDVIAYSGRQLVEDKRYGKYINSPETEIFRKSNVLFGMDKAKKAILKKKVALVCEGQIDAIVCHQYGFDFAIAPLGTACTSQHAKVLKRYTPQVTLCYDSDSAGLKACERAFSELAPEGLLVKVMRLPEGDDPDSFLTREGKEAFAKRMEAAEDFFDFKIENARRTKRLETIEGRTAVTRECADLLAVMGDTAARDQQLNVVTTALSVASATLRDNVKKAIRRTQFQNRRNQAREENQNEEDTLAGAEPTPLGRAVGDLCYLALTAAPAQFFLAEQFEVILEAKEWIPGVELLEKIISSAPDPESSAAVNAFLASLPEADQLALNQVLGRQSGGEENPLAAAEVAVGKLSSLTLEQRDLAVQSRLREPGLSVEELTKLLEEAKELGALMRGTDRSHYDDELPPETKKPQPKPWQKKWKS